MVQNPQNAVLHLGHQNGTVTLWTPNLPQPVVKMLCHKSPVLDLQITGDGNYMCTSGLDSLVHVWDLRTYRKLHTYASLQPATTLAISQKNHLCIGSGSRLQIYDRGLLGKQVQPYMCEQFNGSRVTNCTFCPYEDVLSVCGEDFFKSLVVPGSGEPNFDTFVENPYQTSRQRRDLNVQR
uniref:Putative U3 small nucleolar RNA-associated protein 7 n=1 Tax=Lygus hesperus TaxID=30085 RepID=A0A0A9X569_LYGHE